MNAVIELTQAQRVVIIGPNDLPGLWEQLEPLIEKGCSFSQGQFNTKSIVDGILDGSYQMLAYLDGQEILSIAVLTISQFPTGLRIAELLICSGEGMRDWRKFEPQVAELAKQYGCSRFRAIGREGLQRMLPDWRRTSIVLEKVID